MPTKEIRKFWVSIAGVAVATLVAGIGLLAAGHLLLPPSPPQTITVHIEQAPK